MLPDEMEAEKNRKMILAQADEIDILKKNVHDLQEQLNSAHKRVASLNEDWADMRDKLDYLKERCNFSDVENHYMENSVVVTREEV